MERSPMILLVGEVDVDGRMGEQHARILQACRLSGRTCEMQHGATELVKSIHLERRGNVLACPRLASTRTLASLRVGGRAISLEEPLERLLVAEGKVDMEEGHAALNDRVGRGLLQRHFEVTPCGPRVSNRECVGADKTLTRALGRWRCTPKLSRGLDKDWMKKGEECGGGCRGRQ